MAGCDFAEAGAAFFVCTDLCLSVLLVGVTPLGLVEGRRVGVDIEGVDEGSAAEELEGREEEGSMVVTSDCDWFCFKDSEPDDSTAQRFGLERIAGRRAPSERTKEISSFLGGAGCDSGESRDGEVVTPVMLRM